MLLVQTKKAQPKTEKGKTEKAKKTTTKTTTKSNTSKKVSTPKKPVKPTYPKSNTGFKGYDKFKDAADAHLRSMPKGPKRDGQELQDKAIMAYLLEQCRNREDFDGALNQHTEQGMWDFFFEKAAEKAKENPFFNPDENTIYSWIEEFVYSEPKTETTKDLKGKASAKETKGKSEVSEKVEENKANSGDKEEQHEDNKIIQFAKKETTERNTVAFDLF